jgi:hypothetical protein
VLALQLSGNELFEVRNVMELWGSVILCACSIQCIYRTNG